MNLITPKLNRRNSASLYPYYAGYSYEFVYSTLSKYINDTSTVLDPWSGTGLTSITAKQFGCFSTGIDINPVMTVIAKANNISRELSPSIISLKTEIIKKFKYSREHFRNDDGLNLWFSPYAVGTIRSLEMIIYKLLVNSTNRDNLLVDENNLSSLASFFYLILFKIVKKYIKQNFSSSNPTWVKVAKCNDKKINLDRSSIIYLFDKFLEEQLLIVNSIDYFNKQCNLSKFITGNSNNLPIANNSIDYILTSPPYCTRIDYAVAMRPELSILGINDSLFKNLRSTVTGSTTIRKQKVFPKQQWGLECNKFLDQVKEHPSIASKGYYYTNLLQYFDDMYNSFYEIARVCKVGANFSLVVQDSFYKELHNNLPLFFEEMLASLNFRKTDIASFKSNSFDNINPRSAKYVKKQKTQEFFINFYYEGK